MQLNILSAVVCLLALVAEIGQVVLGAILCILVFTLCINLVCRQEVTRLDKIYRLVPHNY